MKDFCNAMRQAQKDGVDNKTLSDEWIDTLADYMCDNVDDYLFTADVNVVDGQVVVSYEATDETIKTHIIVE